MVSIIEIVLYTKPTAEHQYRVLCSSCHHLHTKRAFSFSLALRIRRICSSNETYNLGLLNQEIQRFHTITHTHSLKRPPRVSLQLSDTTLPFAQFHLYFTSTFTFSYPPNFVRPCLNIFLSLPSYVLTSRKFVKWTVPVRNQSSRLMLWCYTLFKVLYFSARSSSATGGHLYRVQVELLKGRWTVWGPRGPLSRYI